MQNVRAAGEIGGEADFSTWTFTYTEDFHLIAEGQNELTAKISCTSSESYLDFNTFPGGSTTTTPASGALP
jgi:hypothetical protein